MAHYLYIGVGLDAAAVFSTEALARARGRDHVTLDPGALDATANPIRELDRPGLEGVVIAAAAGVVDRARLRIARAALSRGLQVWLHWPNERTVEYVDHERLRMLARLRRAVIAMQWAARPVLQWFDARKRLGSGLRWIYRGTIPIRRQDREEMIARLDEWSRAAVPVPFARDRTRPPSRGPGLYLRTDFWNNSVSGGSGSYGHTCFVAKELAATADRFVCLLPHRYELLDALGVFQAVMDGPAGFVGEEEDAMVTASTRYYPMVKTACEVLQPAYIYERLCLGNWTASLLSRELRIPYIVEYNGSEITMHRSKNNKVLVYSDVYEKAEEFAFRQATAINVVSENVKGEIVKRGVDPRKILVNPNGADLERYAPPTPADKQEIRHRLGFADDECVVGFTGTFGWWHGVDVLAAAIPLICREVPSAQFLLIGDGTHKYLLDAEVQRHGLDRRVLRVGTVAQAEGARLLKACDIYVAPHNRHMVGVKFFGSPTKVFEYMAMGGGIVASDLEQIGEVLSPALRPDALARDDVAVADERAVLCRPGDVDEFVAGVVGLARRRDIGCALGRNARRAVAEHYSWKLHVERLWDFIDRLPEDLGVSPHGARRAGQPHTLKCFLELERECHETSARWIPVAVDPTAYAGRSVLEVGAGLGHELVRFANHGASVSGIDRSVENARLAEENFRLRGLNGLFAGWDGERFPFDADSFDLVYSNGLDHVPALAPAIAEIHRVLKPGGAAIVALPAERSLQYWCEWVWKLALSTGDISCQSLGAILARTLAGADAGRAGVVQVCTRRQVRQWFGAFVDVRVRQRQVSPDYVPVRWRRHMPTIERLAGCTLVIHARKPDCG
jgi:glycosyltransferase involved in cell wall biosynthesis/protein-L-isoaspartate O-methyltransferase